MHSMHHRRVLLAALIPVYAFALFLALTGARRPAVEVVLGPVLLTTLLIAVIRAAWRRDPHRINLVQKKAYSITWRSVVATTALTGLAVFLMLTLASMVFAAVTSYAGYTPLSVVVLETALTRIHTLAGLPLLILVVTYGIAVVGMGTGFWLLYPYIPVQDEELAGPLTFVVAWLYGVFFVALLLPTDPLSGGAFGLVLDAALVAVWGKFFAVAYEDVQAYVP